MPAEPAHPAATPGPGTAQQSWHPPASCCHTAEPRKTSSTCQAALRQDGELLTERVALVGLHPVPARRGVNDGATMRYAPAGISLLRLSTLRRTATAACALPRALPSPVGAPFSRRSSIEPDKSTVKSARYARVLGDGAMRPLDCDLPRRVIPPVGRLDRLSQPEPSTPGKKGPSAGSCLLRRGERVQLRSHELHDLGWRFRR
jgi:hypothetical protein